LSGIGSMAAAEPLTPPQAEAELFNSMNAERAAYGLAPLERRTGVDEVALRWSSQMAAGEITTPYGLPTWESLRNNPEFAAQVDAQDPWSWVGENVGGLYADGSYGAKTLAMWLASPAYREQVLSAKYTSVGIGIAVSGSGHAYATADLYRRQSEGVGTFPARPSGLVVPQVETSSARVGWNSFDASVTGFVVCVQTAVSGTATIQRIETGPQARSIAVTGLEPGERYFVAVQALMGGIVGEPSNVIDFTTALAQFATPPAPEIVGVTEVGETLTVDAGVWNPEPSLSYQWYSGSRLVVGATDSRYRLTEDDVGERMWVEVTGRLKGYRTTSVLGGPSATVVALKEFSVRPAPLIDGRAEVGSRLRVVIGEWNPDADLTVRWRRDGVDIDGAEDEFFDVTDADKGHRLSVAVTARRSGYATVTRFSEPTPRVTAVFSPQTPPVIAGEAEVGATLRVRTGLWSPEPGFSYQWCASGQPIAGADGDTYVLTVRDVGYELSVVVTATGPDYTTVRMESARTAPVALRVFSPQPRPSVVGSPIVGQTLSAVTGQWAPAPSFRFQWHSDQGLIDGAQDSTYRLTARDLGRDVWVVVTAEAAGFESVSVPSARVGPVVLATYASTPVPVIAGQAVAGETLSVRPGTWASGAVLTYQWYVDDVPVAWATGATFTLSEAEAGSRVGVRVQGTHPEYGSVAAMSELTPTVRLRPFAASPVPVVRGSARVGVRLRADVGLWNPDPVLRYQWLRDGVPIPGANGTSYVPLPADVGRAVSLKVTAQAPSFVTVSKISEPTAVVKRGTFEVRPKPKVKGNPVVGAKIVAKAGTWRVRATLSYRWYRDGKPIKGAIKATYRLKAADAGTRVWVAVKATRPGYTTVIKKSVPTRVQQG
jgi:hypothetical protein